MLFYRCEETLFAGANLPYENNTDISSFDLSNFRSNCNSHETTGRGCDCDLNLYNPICINGITYFSPCHAGCEFDGRVVDQFGKLRTDWAVEGLGICHCVSNSNMVSATLGKCAFQKTCKTGPFMGLYFLAVFINFLPGVSATTALLRVVPVSMKSQAVGLNTFIIRLIGTIPGPLIGGALIDK